MGQAIGKIDVENTGKEISEKLFEYQSSAVKERFVTKKEQQQTRDK